MLPTTANGVFGRGGILGWPAGGPVRSQPPGCRLASSRPSWRRSAARSRNPGRYVRRSLEAERPGRQTRCLRRLRPGAASGPRVTIARVKSQSFSDAPRPPSSSRGILSASTGNSRSQAIDDQPVPKSSSATLTPSWRSAARRTIIVSTSCIISVSVISTVETRGGVVGNSKNVGQLVDERGLLKLPRGHVDVQRRSAAPTRSSH